MAQNWVIVCADDIGNESYRSFATTLGATYIPATPNLDTFEAAGVRLDRFYVNPICTPTRGLFNTAKFAFRTGIGGNAVPSASGPPTASEPMLAAALDATHICSIVGKEHNFTTSNGNLLNPLKVADGGVCGYDSHLGTHGNIDGPLGGTNFDTYFHWGRYLTSGGTSVLRDLTGANAKIGANAHAAPAPLGAASGIFNRDPRFYATTVTVNDAIAAIAAAGASPFMLFVGLNTAHSPLGQPPTLAERTQVALPTRLMTEKMETVTTAYTQIIQDIDVAANKAILAAQVPPWPTDDDEIVDAAFLAAHIAMAEAMDTELGRLFAAINFTTTTVFMCSDNGPAIDIGVGTTGAKNTQYELGTRVPCLVRGKGVTATGQKCPRLASMPDIHRTILAVEGITPASAVDGVSLVPFFTNVTAPQQRQFVYTEKFETFVNGNPLGGIADIADGSTNDPGKPWVDTWERALHTQTYTLIQFNEYDETTHARSVRYELYAFLGGDHLNGENVLMTQELDFNSARRDTAHKAGLDECLAYLAALEP